MIFSSLNIGDFPMHYEVVMLKDFMDEFIDLSYKEYKDKGLVIVSDEILEHILIKVDLVQFKNIMTNILDNSLKYNQKSLGFIRIGAVVESDSVTLILEDDGVGVPEDTMDKLFDVFYRTDTSRTNTSDGSGIGLAIASRVINRNRTKKALKQSGRLEWE